MRLKNSLIILLNTVSNPQIINEKIIENTATKTVKFNPSLKLGQLTWDLSSSKDSFTYLTIPVILYYFLHGLRDSNSRHLVLETSALPTELNP